MTVTLTFQEWGKSVEPKVGDHVAPDGWQREHRTPFNVTKVNNSNPERNWNGGKLQEGDEADEAWNWEGSAFRLPTGQEVVQSLAVNVRVTGRKVHVLNSGAVRVRCEVEFVRHCEENETVHGWLTVQGPQW